LLSSFARLSDRLEPPASGAAQRLALWARSPRSAERNHAPPSPLGVLGVLAERLRGWPFEDHGLHRPHRLAVGASRRSPDDPSRGHRASRATCRSAVSSRRPCRRGGERSQDSLPEWSEGVDARSTSASCEGSNPVTVMLLLRCGHGEIGPAVRLQTTPGCLEPVWPSGLRRWLGAPVREGMGSNPTVVIRVGVALVSPRPASCFRGPFSRSRQP
jgi:hypothetical protein